MAGEFDPGKYLENVTFISRQYYLHLNISYGLWLFSTVMHLGFVFDVSAVLEFAGAWNERVAEQDLRSGPRLR